MQQTTREYAYSLFHLLQKHYPNAKMILRWSNNFELLVAIILSAQCTDVMVNKVTALLFPTYKLRRQEFVHEYDTYSASVSLPKDEITQLVNFAFTPIDELEEDVRSTGFYKNKAKNVQTAARMVLDTYKGILPRTINELVMIPGVGRKTANVFLGNAYHVFEGIAVDTHVKKQSCILGLTQETEPDKIEQDLMKLFEQKNWFELTYLLIEHGRNKRRAKKDRQHCSNEACMLCQD